MKDKEPGLSKKLIFYTMLFSAYSKAFSKLLQSLLRNARRFVSQGIYINLIEGKVWDSQAITGKMTGLASHPDIRPETGKVQRMPDPKSPQVPIFQMFYIPPRFRNKYSAKVYPFNRE